MQAVLNIENVQPKDHITVNVDAKATGEANLGESSGDGASFITIDDGTNDRDEDIWIDGIEEIPVPGDGDEPEPELPDAPSLEWPANSDFSDMTIENGMDVNLVVKVPGRIAGFVVGIESSVLNGMLGSSLDLLDPETAESLEDLLPTGDALKGQTSVEFSLSSVVPLIATIGAEPGSRHTFTLNVTDEYDQTLTKALTFVMPE